MSFRANPYPPTAYRSTVPRSPNVLPKLVGSSWRRCVLRYLYSDPLYQYKGGPTPDRFRPDQKLLAFRISYDVNSQTTPLEIFPMSSRTPISIIPTVDTIEFSDTKKYFRYHSSDNLSGWYLSDGDIAKNDWDTLRLGLERYAQDELNLIMGYRARFDTSCHGIRPLWAIRGYFIGPDTASSPPYITVLCSDEYISKLLVDSLHKRRVLWQYWGVTRLPKVRVLEYGFGSGSPGNPDSSANPNVPEPRVSDQEILATAEAEAERQLKSIEVRVTNDHPIPVMANEDLSSWADQRHRCGVRLNVIRGPKVIAKGTIGGLIKVGDTIYGLTVAHVFSPSSAITANQHHGQDEQGGPSTSAAVESTSTSNDGTFAILNRWQNTDAISMEFDWALVEIPGLQQSGQNPDSWDDVNLVQTVSGDFRPVLIEPHEPCRNVQVVLATPGSANCIRGIFIGYEAIVNLPGSPIPHAVWVLRMEQPWLIQPGDSGSWAFDARSGNLLGVLVAGCPELQEAYILPAYQIIDDIEAQFGGPVTLPNCHPARKADQVNLADCVRAYKDMKTGFVNIGSLKELQNLESCISRWTTRNSTTFADLSTLSFNPRSQGDSWTETLVILDYPDLLNAGEMTEREIREIFNKEKPAIPMAHLWDFDRLTSGMPDLSIELGQRILREPPLRCYNFIMTGMRAYGTKDQFDDVDAIYITKLRRMWWHLILGETSFSLSDNNVPKASVHTNISVIENEIDLMAYVNPSYPEIKRPWDRRTFTKVIDEMRENLEAKVFDHRTPVELSLWETQDLELGPAGTVVLFAAVVLNKRRDRVAVIEASSFRLPVILGTRTLEDAENLKQLLTTQLKRDVADFDHLEKIDLGPMHSGCYLVEHKRYIDMIVYEAVLRVGHEELTTSTGQAVYSFSIGDAKGILASPFSVAIEKSSAADRL